MKTLIIAFVKLYQYMISTVLPSSCRFTPSCSEYSIESLKEYGAVKGSYLTIKRILKCHPFHPGGYDPVEKR